MATRVTPEVVGGLGDLQARLDQLELYAQSDVVKKAAASAMEYITLKAAANAPRKTGALELAIRTRPGKTAAGFFSWIAGASRRWFSGNTFYGAFQEFGWKHGHRRRSVAAQEMKLFKQSMRQARLNRETNAEGMRLAKRGTRIRMIQERLFRVEAKAAATEAGDTRKVIAGRHFVQKAFESEGQTVLDAFARSVKAGLEREGA